MSKKDKKKCKKCGGKGFYIDENNDDIVTICNPCWIRNCNDSMAKNKTPLTFARFQETNVSRSKSDIKHSYQWSSMEWGCALAGEVGELCNFLKKISRGDKIPKKHLAHEISDIMTYLGLLANNLDIDLENAIIEKFNIVSKRWGSKYRL
jgi:NTP pyrophosphatase (non-canonical NTP hydrolase)